MSQIDKIKKLVVSLKCNTEKGKFIWQNVISYSEIKRNEWLRRYLINRSTYYSGFSRQDYILNERKSYCTEINDGIVYLLFYTKGNNEYSGKYELSMQNNKDSEIIDIIMAQKFQDELSDISRIINESSNNIDEFIEFIINENE